MNGTMKVAVMEGIGKMGYTERPIPTPKDDEVYPILPMPSITATFMVPFIAVTSFNFLLLL